MKFIIRLDDACPGMDHVKWEYIEKLLDKYKIKPIVAVIPDDKYFSKKEYTDVFWNKVRMWRDKGWKIGLHGLTHLVNKIQKQDKKYIFFAKKSEFTDLNLKQQGELLQKAIAIFKIEGIEPEIFVAPNHGFNYNTLNALKMYTSISIVSDGIALHPYEESGITFIPQLDWKLQKFYFGTRTICLHPSMMSENEIRKFEKKLQKCVNNADTVESILSSDIQSKNLDDYAFAFLFKLYFKGKIYIYNKLKRL